MTLDDDKLEAAVRAVASEHGFGWTGEGRMIDSGNPRIVWFKQIAVACVTAYRRRRGKRPPD